MLLIETVFLSQLSRLKIIILVYLNLKWNSLIRLDYSAFYAVCSEQLNYDNLIHGCSCTSLSAAFYAVSSVLKSGLSSFLYAIIVI
jgi:hypothetical protein